MVRHNQIAASQAGWLADYPYGVQGKALLDNASPSSDNSLDGLHYVYALEEKVA